MSKTPIYIITGFLGSGKTTLLRHIINNLSSLKIAIIQNDFSDEMGIEAPTMVDKDGNLFKEFFELPNGCVCCTIKDELLKSVEYLLKKKKFDKILIETTGIADPEPIIEKFWVDGELESDVKLSGVITVVDCFNFKKYLNLDFLKNILKHENSINTSSKDIIISNFSESINNDVQTDELSNKNENKTSKLLSPEIFKQIMLANKIILNKIDLIRNNLKTSDSVLNIKDIEDTIRVINPTASIASAMNSQVLMEWIFELDAYNIDNVNLEIEYALKNKLTLTHPKNDFLSNISSFTLLFENVKFDYKLLEKLIADIVWEGDCIDDLNLGKLIRYKAIFNSINPNNASITSYFALQGVGQIFEILPINNFEYLKYSKFFFLGINLDKTKFKEKIKSCLLFSNN